MIRAIMVDDEIVNLHIFSQACQDTGIKLVGTFDNAPAALKFAASHPIDFALLDIQMPEMDGITLGKRLRAINSDVVLIFLTGYERYLKEAILDLKADYYVMKPYDIRDMSELVERAIYLSRRLKKKVEIRTFGEFDVFVDGILVEFTNQKAKELFAVCVDQCGGEVAMKKIIDLLWEDRDYDERVKGLYRKAVAYLNKIFQQYGIEDIFDNARGSCHVNRQEVSCDYYEVLDGRNINETLFDGRYMSNYSWGEETCGKLCHMAQAYLR